MNEQEQTAKTPLTAPAPLATLEPERRSVYLPKENLIVNTSLRRAQDLQFAIETELRNKNKDNYFAYQRLDESIPDTTHRWWKTPYRAVANAGVSMWQSGERLMAGGIGAILDEYEYSKAARATSRKYAQQAEELNQGALAVPGAQTLDKRKKDLYDAYLAELHQIRQDYEHNRKLGRDALLVMSKNNAKFRELAGIEKNEKDGFLYDLFGAAGSLMAAIGLTVLTGSPAAAAIAFGATAGQQDYEEALQNGVAPDRALLSGIAGGAFEGGIELLGMEMLFKSLTKTGVLGRIAASALSEGSEEAAQQTAEEIIMQHFGGRQQDLADTLQGIGYSFVIGSLTAVPVATLVNRASKKLQDKGIKKETADKMALNMAKATATPENNAQVHKILSNATSPLVYPNGDVEQGAQAFKESVDKARNPDRETTRKMYEVAERTEQKALAAGYDTDSAALLGNLEQSRANSVLNVAGLKPGEFEMTEVDFENAPMQDNTEAVQAAVAAQREQWKLEYEEQQARKAQADAAANEELDRKLADAGLTEKDFLLQETINKNAVDLTAPFADIAKLPADQRAQQVESSLNALIGQAMDTATPPLQIQITADNKVHIKNSNVKLKNGKLKRHQTALTTLEKIVNVAQKTDRKGAVDVSHNTSKKTLAHKANVEEYVYFPAPVKIGEDTFLVELATERVKGQDKNLLDLYNVHVKRNPATAHLSTYGQGSSTDRITNNEEFVKAKESGKTNNPSELLQENLFNIQQNLFDKQQSLFDTQVNAEERTELTQEDSELKETADGLFSEEELKQDLPPFTPTGKPERIEDFGEKILGARKDMWGKYRAAMTSELPADVRSITLSQYFPEPNYEAAIAKGITTEQLAIVKALRDSLPVKPQRPARAAQWVEGLKAARETANHVLQHPEMVNLFKETDKTDAIHNRVAFYLEIGYPAFTKAKEYSLRPGNFLMFNGQRFNEPQKIYLLERGYKRVAGSQNRAEMVALARKMLAQSAAPAKAPTKLDVYQRRDTGEIIIGKKIATGKFIDLKGGFERVRMRLTF